jgi:SNF2 family DNA or RNA helicase
MEKEMFIALANGTEIEAFGAAAKTMKSLQLCAGAIYTDDSGAWAEVHDVKLQALEEIVEEAAGMPVLVAYHFKSDLARLLKRFPKGRALDKDPRTIADWNAGKIPVMFAHPASAGHGLNLQDGGNILVYFSHNWNLEERMQILERIGPTRQAQAGHNRPVFVHNILAAGTIDELVLARIGTKRSVQDLLLSAMKTREAVHE